MTDRERLISLLEDINDEIDYAGETSMIDDGMLTSLEILSIVVELNAAFDVRISVAELEPENFNSVDAMLELVRKKRNAQ